jgi:dTDP-4-dehydrorhamnose reductase
MPNPPRWLVMGAGSWLGHLLLEQEAAAGAQLFGTIHRQQPNDLPASVQLQPAHSADDYLRWVEEFKPDILVNFLRGEDEAGFSVHTTLADHCRRHGIFYVYLSSVLALDGYQGEELREELPPRSITPYGQFKACCENYLQEKGGEALVVRFASAQGWVPHKPTRNEMFLSKIARGEKVTVDTGVSQNRLPADWLMEALRALAGQRISGVVHLGATDASEELDFLRREAAAFGWSPQLVEAGRARAVNLNCRPGKIFQIFGERFRRNEADTLDFLVRHPGLQRWHNPHQS